MLVLPLVAAAALLVGNNVLFEDGAPSRFVFHADGLNGCSTSTLLTEPPEPGCVQPAPDSEGLTVLIGDSNAGQFTEGFMAAASAANLDARVATRPSCPFTDLRVWDLAEESECHPYVEASIEELVRLQPKLVFLARNSDGYIESPRFQTLGADGTFVDSDPDSKAAAWEAADERMIRRLEAAGIGVVIINPVPKFPGWETVDIAPIRLVLPLRWVERTFPRAYALNARRRATDAEVLAAADGAEVLDVFDDLCPDDPCSTNQDGRVIYRDGGHISVLSARGFKPEFERLMTTA